MKTIEENNRLIAQFMGFDENEKGQFSIPNVGNIEDYLCRFHESWDWLMPIVEEIDHLEYESDGLDAIDNAIKTRVIADVYNAVIKFIEWYNENL